MTSLEGRDSLAPDRREKPIPGYSHFGSVYATTQRTWGFSNTDLAKTGLITPTQIQTISRVLRDPEKVASLRPPVADRLTISTTGAISQYLQAKLNVNNEYIEKLRNRLKQSFTQAIERDRHLSLEGPLAVRIASKLSEITGQSHLALDLAIEDAKTLEEFLINLKQLSPRQQ